MPKFGFGMKEILNKNYSPGTLDLYEMIKEIDDYLGILAGTVTTLQFENSKLERKVYILEKQLKEITK